MAKNNGTEFVGSNEDIQKNKKIWSPATRNGVPMTYHFEYGMGMSVGYNYDKTNKDNN
jgi:hypothetical protein